MSGHRREVRPRYGRIAAVASSVTISAVAALAGMGVLATSSAHAGATTGPASYDQVEARTTPDQTTPTGKSGHPGPGKASSTPSVPPGSVSTSHGTSNSADERMARAIPSQSGHGRRIVFSQSRQRVWLVGTAATGSGGLERTYLVSGSVTHNLQPGTYSVYSKSRWAVGVDDSGVMQYFVRFTQGPTGAAIGFHSIPTHNGTPLQTRAQLGTPQSHGCIRQDLPDAIALWKFAPVGTKVVVVA